MDTSVIPQPTTFWRNAIHGKIDYFDSTFKMGGDFDFFAKAGKCCRIVHINKPLARFRIHNASLTMRQRQQGRDEVGIVHDRYIDFSKMQQKVLSWSLTLQLKFLNLELMFKKAYHRLRKANTC